MSQKSLSFLCGLFLVSGIALLILRYARSTTLTSRTVLFTQQLLKNNLLEFYVVRHPATFYVCSSNTDTNDEDSKDARCLTENHDVMWNNNTSICEHSTVIIIVSCFAVGQHAVQFHDCLAEYVQPIKKLLE